MSNVRRRAQLLSMLVPWVFFCFMLLSVVFPDDGIYPLLLLSRYKEPSARRIPEPSVLPLSRCHTRRCWTGVAVELPGVRHDGRSPYEDMKSSIAPLLIFPVPHASDP